MKNYYNRLDKKKRKEIREEVKKANSAYKKINLYFLLDYLCLIFLLFDIYFRYTFDGKIIDYVIDGLMIVVLLVFYYKLSKIKDNMLNKYALEHKK